MYPCGLCGEWINDGDIYWYHVWKEHEERRKEIDAEIDRAMTLMIDALAYREAAQEIKEKENARWGCEPIDYDREFEVIIRYLEKVEQELEANNE
jgi:hypothetical protein